MLAARIFRLAYLSMSAMDCSQPVSCTVWLEVFSVYTVSRSQTFSSIFGCPFIWGLQGCVEVAGSNKGWRRGQCVVRRCKRAWPEQASGGATSTSAGRLWSPTF